MVQLFRLNWTNLESISYLHLLNPTKKLDHFKINNNIFHYCTCSGLKSEFTTKIIYRMAQSPTGLRRKGCVFTKLLITLLRVDLSEGVYPKSYNCFSSCLFVDKALLSKLYEHFFNRKIY